MPDLWSDTEGVTIPEGAFFNTHAQNGSTMQKLILGMDWMDNVHEIEKFAFSGMYFPSGTELDFPNLTTIAVRAFTFCRGVVSIKAEDCTSVGEYCFSDMNHLRELRLPSLPYMLPSTALYSVSTLTTLVLSSITGSSSTSVNLGNVANYTGSSASRITTLDLGYVQRFTNHQREFIRLETLVIRYGAPVSFSATTVYAAGFLSPDCPIAQGNGKIYVPAALISAYEQATGWSDYAGCFEAIEGSDWEI